MTTARYTLFDVPRPKQKFVHVHPGAEELGQRLSSRSSDQCGYAAISPAAGAHERSGRLALGSA